MTSAAEDRPFRRLFLALDAAGHGLPLFDVVADLAARLQAEMSGFFLEDPDLVGCAELPMARHVSLLTGASEAVEPAATSRELRALAARIRTRMAAAAERRRVRWSFQVVRGGPDEAVTAARETDLVVLGLPGRGGAFAASARCSRPVLAVRNGLRLDGPVVAVAEEAEAADRVLPLAARLAAGSARELAILLAADSDRERQDLGRRATGILERSGAPGGILAPPSAGPQQPGRQAREAGAGLLVLSADGRLFQAWGLEELLDQARCPVILLR